MQVTWDEFEKIDMRVGTIMEVSDFPKARNPSYQIKIDFGALGVKNLPLRLTNLYQRTTDRETSHCSGEFSTAANCKLLQ